MEFFVRFDTVMYSAKPALSGHSKIDKTKILEHSAIRLPCIIRLKTNFWSFLSGRFTQALLYIEGYLVIFFI